ncbi:MAG: MFS transporter [Desulfobacterales bacterium]|nr:MFS transporter [Desulfobacterales bacterium]
MEVGLRPVEESVDEPPNPEATTPRFYSTGLPIFFKTNFAKNIADWGLILSGFQAGSCLATFLLPRRSSSFRQETIFSVTFLILGGAMALLGYLTTHIQIALLMILLGCGFTFIHVFLESLIQQY